MKPAAQHAREAWCYLTLGNIAVPANADAATKELTPFFEKAMTEARTERAAEVEQLRQALVQVRADLAEIRDTEPARRASPSITILANTGIGICDQALHRKT